MEQLAVKELAAAYCEETSLQQELEAAYCDKKSLQKELEAAYLLDPTRVRELELSLAQLCKSHFANQSFQNELVAAYRANQGLAVFTAHHLGQTKARELSASTAQLCTLAAGKLQVARDLRSPESIHYVPLPQTMQPYLPLDDHDMYMDLCNVVQNNLAGKGPDPAGAEVLRYENVFPNITTDSVDLVVKAETSYHPKRPANQWCERRGWLH